METSIKRRFPQFGLNGDARLPIRLVIWFAVILGFQANHRGKVWHRTAAELLFFCSPPAQLKHSQRAAASVQQKIGDDFSQTVVKSAVVVDVGVHSHAFDAIEQQGVLFVECELQIGLIQIQLFKATGGMAVQYPGQVQTGKRRVSRRRMAMLISRVCF